MVLISNDGCIQDQASDHSLIERLQGQPVMLATLNVERPSQSMQFPKLPSSGEAPAPTSE